MMFRPVEIKTADEVVLKRLLLLSILLLAALSFSLVSVLKFLTPASIANIDTAANHKRAWNVSRSNYLLDAQLAHIKDFYKDSAYLEQLIKKHSKAEEPSELAKAIILESKRANFDPVLLTAIIKAESTFNYRAQSNAGAIGLMQIRPSTARYVSEKVGEEDLREQKLMEPQYNIRVGVAYLKYLEELFGNKELALIAYNWGPTKLSRALKFGEEIPAGPQNYAKKILALKEKWKPISDRQIALLDVG